MRKLYNKTTWLLIPLLFSVSGYSQFPARKYLAGETYKYKLTTNTWQNDKYQGEAVAISEHRVINDGGTFAEEIKWLNKTSKNASDTVRVMSIARMVPAYRISLAPEGKVLLPK